MEHLIKLHIERLPDGVYLATSDEIPGLVAQGRTIQETPEIARDMCKKLIEARAERADPPDLPLCQPLTRPFPKAHCAPSSSRPEHVSKRVMSVDLQDRMRNALRIPRGLFRRAYLTT